MTVRAVGKPPTADFDVPSLVRPINFMSTLTMNEAECESVGSST